MGDDLNISNEPLTSTAGMHRRGELDAGYGKETAQRFYLEIRWEECPRCGSPRPDCECTPIERRAL